LDGGRERKNGVKGERWGSEMEERVERRGGKKEWGDSRKKR
jgi:hypothetical protein